MPSTWRVVVITGPVGAGKTTTLEAVSGTLADARVLHVAIDMDEIRLMFPRGPDDIYGARLGLANLAAMVPNIRAEGVEVLLLADVVEDPSQRASYAEACPGAAVKIVRLSVPAEVMRARLHKRESEETVQWYLTRAAELETMMDDRHVGDIIVTVGNRSPRDVAMDVVAGCGLLAAR